MTCGQLRPISLLYALGVMEEPERSEMRTHLEHGCESCTGALRESRMLGYCIGAAVTGPDPSPELRRRILAIAGAVPRERRRPLPFWFRPTPAWQGLALAAACVLLALLPGWALYRQLSRTKTGQAATVAALDREKRSAESLRNEVARLGSASGAVPIFALEPVRGSGANEPLKQLAIPRGSTAVVLALAKDLARHASSAQIVDASGLVVWSLAALPAGDSDSVGLTVPAGILLPGQYTLILRAGDRTMSRLPFLVIPEK